MVIFERDIAVDLGTSTTLLFEGRKPPPKASRRW